MHFESSWIVWLKDTAAALMIGTVCDHEEVKNCIVASPPLISPAIILSTDFTIMFPFVLPSQTQTGTVMQRRGLLIFLSTLRSFFRVWCICYIDYTPTNCSWFGMFVKQFVYEMNWTDSGLNNKESNGAQWHLSWRELPVTFQQTDYITCFNLCRAKIILLLYPSDHPDWSGGFKPSAKSKEQIVCILRLCKPQKHSDLCVCHMYHTNISTIRVISRSHHMYISNDSNNDGGMKAAKSETTVQDCVSPFVSVKPLDTSNNYKYCDEMTRCFQFCLWQQTKPKQAFVPKSHQTIKQLCHNIKFKLT